MRIRSIKPEFWRSDDIAALDWGTRLLFVGLWSYVDDNGVGLDKVAAITADLFAADLVDNPRETVARVSGGLQTLSDRGLITRYMVAGRAYLHITTWESHQRIDKPNKSRYPLPTCGNAEPRETVATSSRDPRETPAPGTGEQGNRGSTTPSASATAERRAGLPEGFADWWQLYPRKKDKGHAVKAYRAALKKASAQALLAGLKRDLPDLRRREPDKVPYASTWLNGERWDDEAPLALVRNGEPEGIGRRLTLAEMAAPGWRPAGDVR